MLSAYKIQCYVSQMSKGIRISVLIYVTVLNLFVGIYEHPLLPHSISWKWWGWGIWK